MTFSSIRRSWYSRVISFSILIAFMTSMVITPRAYAQDGVLGLPQPGTMVELSPAYVPLMLTGLTVHPENPLLMDFIVSTGNSGLNADQVKKQSDRLIKYFLACLTIPENNQWVNLSPYEKDRIVPEDLGQTVLGRDMLAQDYLLKQLTASLIYPEKNLGKNFWDKVYAKADQMYGTTQIPVNTFNKVWILPQYAKVYEHNNTVFVVKSHLKVMLDEDYLAMSKHQGQPGDMALAVSPSTLPSDLGSKVKASQVNHLGSEIVRSIILPAIEQEVNTGKNFAQLRQIYNSVILAVWFKKNLREALLNQVYTDKSKINGVNVDDPAIKEKIYHQYLQAYKKGVFNYIKEETDPNTQETIPRKYFSGGEFWGLVDPQPAMVSEAMAAFKSVPGSHDYVIEGKALGAGNRSAAMTSHSLKDMINAIEQLIYNRHQRLKFLDRRYHIIIRYNNSPLIDIRQWSDDIVGKMFLAFKEKGVDRTTSKRFVFLVNPNKNPEESIDIRDPAMAIPKFVINVGGSVLNQLARVPQAVKAIKNKIKPLTPWDMVRDTITARAIKYGLPDTPKQKKLFLAWINSEDQDIRNVSPPMRLITSKDKKAVLALLKTMYRYAQQFDTATIPPEAEPFLLKWAVGERGKSQATETFGELGKLKVHHRDFLMKEIPRIYYWPDEVPKGGNTSLRTLPEDENVAFARIMAGRSSSRAKTAGTIEPVNPPPAQPPGKKDETGQAGQSAAMTTEMMARVLTLSPEIDPKDLDTIRQAEKSGGAAVRNAVARLQAEIQKTITATDPQKRTLKANQELLARGGKIEMRLPVRLFDGSLSSFDLWEFIEAVADEYPDINAFELIAALAAVISDMDDPNDPLYVQVTIEKGEDGKITYDAPDYKVQGFQTDGTITLDNKGRLLDGPRGIAGYWAALFGVNGIKITLNLSNPKIAEGGLEASNVYTEALLLALTEMTGAKLTDGDHYALGLVSSLGPFGDITGYQGGIATKQGNGIMYFLGGIKDAHGKVINPYGVMWEPLFKDDAVREKIEKHLILGKLVSPGTSGEISRTASLINTFWTAVVVGRNREAMQILRDQLRAGHQFKAAEKTGDIAGMQEATRSYIKSRDDMWLLAVNLAFDAEEGKSQDPIGLKLADLIFNQSKDPSNQYAKQFVDMRQMYESPQATKAERMAMRKLLRTKSFYSWDQDPETKAILDEFGAVAFPAGAGGPGANCIIIIRDPDEKNQLIAKLGKRLPEPVLPKIGTKTAEASWIMPDGTRKPIDLSPQPLRNVNIAEVTSHISQAMTTTIKPGESKTFLAPDRKTKKIVYKINGKVFDFSIGMSGQFSAFRDNEDQIYKIPADYPRAKPFMHVSKETVVVDKKNIEVVRIENLRTNGNDIAIDHENQEVVTEAVLPLDLAPKAQTGPIAIPPEGLTLNIKEHDFKFWHEDGQIKFMREAGGSTIYTVPAEYPKGESTKKLFEAVMAGEGEINIMSKWGKVFTIRPAYTGTPTESPAEVQPTPPQPDIELRLKPLDEGESEAMLTPDQKAFISGILPLNITQDGQKVLQERAPASGFLPGKLSSKNIQILHNINRQLFAEAGGQDFVVPIQGGERIKLIGKTKKGNGTVKYRFWGIPQQFLNNGAPRNFALMLKMINIESPQQRAALVSKLIDLRGHAVFQGGEYYYALPELNGLYPTLLQMASEFSDRYGGQDVEVEVKEGRLYVRLMPLHDNQNSTAYNNAANLFWNWIEGFSTPVPQSSSAMTSQELIKAMDDAGLIEADMKDFTWGPVFKFVVSRKEELINSFGALQDILNSDTQERAPYRQVVAQSIVYLPELHERLVDLLIDKLIKPRLDPDTDKEKFGDPNIRVKMACMDALAQIGEKNPVLRRKILDVLLNQVAKIGLHTRFAENWLLPHYTWQVDSDIFQGNYRFVNLKKGRVARSIVFQLFQPKDSDKNPNVSVTIDGRSIHKEYPKEFFRVSRDEIINSFTTNRAMSTINAAMHTFTTPREIEGAREDLLGKKLRITYRTSRTNGGEIRKQPGYYVSQSAGAITFRINAENRTFSFDSNESGSRFISFQVDHAALAIPAIPPNGGIDLNSKNLNMESSGEKVNITFDPAMIAQFKRGDFSGVRIQILDVVPVNLMPLLGLKEDEAQLALR